MSSYMDLYRSRNSDASQPWRSALRRPTAHAAEAKQIQPPVSPSAPSHSEHIRQTTGPTGKSLGREAQSSFSAHLVTEPFDVGPHDSSANSALSNALNVRALTQGADTYFAARQHSSTLGQGRRPLAHQGSHMIEQHHGAPPQARRTLRGEPQVTVPNMQMVNKTPAVTVPPDTRRPLDIPQFRNRMTKALIYLLERSDPARWKQVGNIPLKHTRELGTIIYEEALDFFKPYTDERREAYAEEKKTNTDFSFGKQYIISTKKLKIDSSMRQGFLRARARELGTYPNKHELLRDPNILYEVNFFEDRDQDKKELERIVTELSSNSKVQKIIDRLIRTTARLTPDKEIAMPTKFNLTQGEFDESQGPSRDIKHNSVECESLWERIETLCHEIMHFLMSTRYKDAVEINKNNIREDVGGTAVAIEGFANFLAVDLYNDRIRNKSNNDQRFKESLEKTTEGAPCGDRPANLEGYSAATASARKIYGKIGRDSFLRVFLRGNFECLKNEKGRKATGCN